MPRSPPAPALDRKYMRAFFDIEFNQFTGPESESQTKRDNPTSGCSGDKVEIAKYGFTKLVLNTGKKRGGKRSFYSPAAFLASIENTHLRLPRLEAHGLRLPTLQ